MKRLNYLTFAIFAMILLTSVGTAVAQSADRDHPTPLIKNEISGDLTPNKLEGFYSLTAGPGELTITVDVQARHADIGVLNFELLAIKSSTPILCCEFAQGDDGGKGQDIKSIKLAKRQTIILHLTNGPVGGGTYTVRFTGATH